MVQVYCIPRLSRCAFEVEQHGGARIFHPFPLPVHGYTQHFVLFAFVRCNPCVGMSVVGRVGMSPVKEEGIRRHEEWWCVPYRSCCGRSLGRACPPTELCLSVSLRRPRARLSFLLFQLKLLLFRFVGVPFSLVQVLRVYSANRLELCR